MHPIQALRQGVVVRLGGGRVQVVPDRPGKRDGPLTQHADAPAQVCGVERGHVGASVADRTSRRGLQPIAEAQQSRLPCARGSNDGGDASAVDASGHALEHQPVGALHFHVDEFKQARSAHGRRM